MAGVRFPSGQEIFLFSRRPVLGPNQPLIQQLPGALSPGVKQLERETDHSHPSDVDVKNDGAIPRLPHASSWRGP
jgi:hypothetical protein